MRSEAAKAFDLDDEPAAVRDAYGRNRFGQGCLLARRLVERGVPFVEVTLGGVNGTGLGHARRQLRRRQERSASTLDPAWATLMAELEVARAARLDADRLDGRVRPHAQDQRQHAAAITIPTPGATVLAGGGIRGGQVVGRTSADGMTVEDRPVTRARFAGHGLHGAGHRSDEAERLERRPPDSPRRSGGQADRGDRGMKRPAGVCCAARARSRWWSGTRRGAAADDARRRETPTADVQDS